MPGRKTDDQLICGPTDYPTKPNLYANLLHQTWWNADASTTATSQPVLMLILVTGEISLFRLIQYNPLRR